MNLISHEDASLIYSFLPSFQVTAIVQAAETIKGTGWVDPTDPTVVAENELLGAAASIEAAARKLAQLQPRSDKPREVDESLNFEEQILEAAKSIAAATAALIKAASATQRELVAQGKVSANAGEEGVQRNFCGFSFDRSFLFVLK